MSQPENQRMQNDSSHHACEMVVDEKTDGIMGAVVDTLQIRSRLIRRRVAAGTTSVTVINQTARGRSSGNQRKRIT